MVPHWRSEHPKSRFLVRVASYVFAKPTVLEKREVPSPERHCEHPCAAVKMSQDGMRRSMVFAALSDHSRARTCILATHLQLEQQDSFPQWSFEPATTRFPVRVASWHLIKQTVTQMGPLMLPARRRQRRNDCQLSMCTLYCKSHRILIA